MGQRSISNIGFMPILCMKKTKKNYIGMENIHTQVHTQLKFIFTYFNPF